MNLSSKISVSVSMIVLAILVVGNWLIWDRLGGWELQRAHLLLAAWTMGGVAFAVYFAVRHITRPLRDLTDLAQALGEGHLDRRLQIESDDEIGRLADAFDHMATSLSAAQNSLGKKVEDRTKELERSQRQLQQAARLAAVGELAAGVAHGVNNPASIILMRAGQLSESEAIRQGSPELEEDLGVIRRQVEKISGIVSGLLTFSRQSSTGGIKSPLDVNELVQRSAGLMVEVFESRGVAVALELTDSLPAVVADAPRVEQVLLNLVNNAVDAMPGGGRLTFGSGRGEGEFEGYVAIFVEDTGNGMHAQQLERVFDPFFTTKEPDQGTGLGLSVSYGIAQDHDGYLVATSEPGEGSRFTLYLASSVSESDDLKNRPLNA
ncbi:MAG: ATP-binding protein [Candidatus Latescibacteria bacterium]|nr:ATP-binding protein [Candidatus Latescibacterota bacterium]